MIEETTLIDLSFTKDPEWIKERQKFWDEMEDDISEELTRNKVNRIKYYFFTGSLQKKDFHCYTIIDFYPRINAESVQFCLKEYLRPFKTGREYEEIQNKFAIGVGGDWTPIETKVELFQYVYGSTYEEGQKFPFLIGKETSYRPLTITPDQLFDYANYNVYVSLKAKYKERPGFWFDLLDYYFSLISHVSDCHFSKMEIENSSQQLCRSRLHGIMRMCFEPTKYFLKSPYVDKGNAFIAEFVERMDSLDYYPGDLKEVWEDIKSEAGA